MLGKRESKSRPNQGIVTIKTIGKNQDSKVVMVFDRAMLVPKSGHAIDDIADY